MSADKSDTRREAKLAQALRANLRRRKAPKPTSEGAQPGPEEEAQGSGSDGR